MQRLQQPKTRATGDKITEFMEPHRRPKILYANGKHETVSQVAATSDVICLTVCSTVTPVIKVSLQTL